MPTMDDTIIKVPKSTSPTQTVVPKSTSPTQTVVGKSFNLNLNTEDYICLLAEDGINLTLEG